MKILLSLIFDRPESEQAFYDHYYKWLIANIPSADIKLFVCKKFFDANEKSHLLDVLNPVLFSEQDMEYIFGSKNIDCFSDKYIKLFNNNLSKTELKKLKETIDLKLNNWIPDIVMTQGLETSYDLWKDVFPKSLILNQENAIFSRPPFNRTLAYDPFRASPDNFLVRFADYIKKFKISKYENKLVNKFKKSLTDIIDKNSPLDDVMAVYKAKFNKLLLLPLIGDRYIKLFNDCICDNEFDLVENVLKKTPQNIGVFVTQHDSGGSLTPENIKYFQSQYSNFIFLQQTDVRGYANNSLNYFKYIDGVLNITSKTGFMAMLWDKPVISLAKQYNKWYEDGFGIESVVDVLNTPYKDKNNALYWYFTHYVVFQEDFGKDDFLYKLLNDWLNKFRRGNIGFDFYSQINDFDKIYDYVIASVSGCYQKQSVCAQTQNPDLQNLLLENAKLKRKYNKLVKKSLKYKIIRFLSHITFGKMRVHFKSMKKSMLS